MGGGKDAATGTFPSFGGGGGGVGGATLISGKRGGGAKSSRNSERLWEGTHNRKMLLQVHLTLQMGT